MSVDPVILPGGRAAGVSFPPADWQSTICFPDDPHKSLVGKAGDLRYDHPGVNQDFDRFGTILTFGLDSPGAAIVVSQEMESPGLPIVTTTLALRGHRLSMKVFASRGGPEGRTDNILVETPWLRGDAAAPAPFVRLQTSSDIEVPEPPRGQSGFFVMVAGRPRLWSNLPLKLRPEEGGALVTCTPNAGRGEWFLRWLFEVNQPSAGDHPDSAAVIADVRKFWGEWQPTRPPVVWELQRHHHDVLVASSRNIAQCREVAGTTPMFQVGPTVYRGLWLVDGHFLLEAAHYLGLDPEAKAGLDALWKLQQDDGGFRSGAGDGHWKDSAAALLALARQSELAQDWSTFQDRWPAVLEAVGYLIRLREQGNVSGTPNGKLGLLPPGFGDSGIGGIRNELANTLWTLIGLKGVLTVAGRLNCPDLHRVSGLYGDLYDAFFAAAHREMRSHPEGFEYLPLLLREDPGWQHDDPSKRILPQAAQIYVAQAIHPGSIIAPDHPVAVGHLRLLRTILKEQIPCCTGWLRENAVWPYSAAIFAGAMLAMGERIFARSLFQGFLDHASPLWAWREEQSLAGIVPPVFIGDMPHNWASAECIRFLRHILVLETPDGLSLAAGLLPSDARGRTPVGVTATPTAWGRVTCRIEPSGTSGWIMSFRRSDFDPVKMAPLHSLVLALRLFDVARLDRIVGAHWKRQGEAIHVDPTATEWTAYWREE